MRALLVVCLLTIAAQCFSELTPVWRRVWSGGRIEASGQYLIAYEPEPRGVLVLNMSTGKEVLRVDGHCKVTVSGEIALAARFSVPWDDPGAIEAWSLSSKKLLWSVPTANYPALGNLSHGHLIYGDTSGLHEIEVPSGKKLRSRGLIRDHSVRGKIHQTPSRIFFSLGHEIFGLDPNDFNRGWRCYVDVGVDIVDRYGVYGFGSLPHDVVAVDYSGKIRWRLNVIGTSFDNASTRPALKAGILAVGGARVRHSMHYVSGYLFALDALSGKHLWKKPMDALAVQSFAGGFAVVASHRRGKEYVQALEVYEPRTGRLLDRHPLRTARWNPFLAAQGPLLAHGDERRLTVYRWSRRRSRR